MSNQQETQQKETNANKGSLFNWLFCGFFEMMNKYRHLPSWQKWIIGLTCIFGVYRFLPIWELFKLFLYIFVLVIITVSIVLILIEDFLIKIGFQFKNENPFSKEWEKTIKKNCELLYEFWKQKYNEEQIIEVKEPEEQAEEV